MPLDDIKEVMLSKKVERLLPFLDQQKKVLEEEEKKIRLAKEKSEQGIDNAMYLRLCKYLILSIK